MGEISRREFVLMAASACTLQAVRDGTAAFAAETSSNDDLAGISLGEASRRMQSKTVTSTQLTQACLERIKTYNPKTNAYITVMTDDAMEQAAALDREAKAGKLRSALHGMPIALKDNMDTAGTRTTGASAVFQDRIPTEDAEVTRRLKEAGAVILGKTNLHEFAMGDTSATSYFGPVRNPWALDHIPGGSSGGSAAAVIADLALGALGSDTGGSVRMPAAFCGVVGLKPTYGLISIRGIIPMIYSLDHCGSLTKTVEDAAMLLNVLAGYDKRDVASVEHPKEDYVAALARPCSDLRVGVPRSPFFDFLDDEIARATEDSLTVLAKLTKSMKDVQLPSSNAISKTSLDGELEAYHMQLFRRDAALYSLGPRRRLETLQRTMNDTATEACSSKVVDYVLARWELVRMRKAIDDAFKDFDLVALPTNRIMPGTIDAALSSEENPKPHEPEETSNNFPFNIFGIPAITIPCGFSANGLPIGLMIAGPRFSEGRVLALANAYEKATQWHIRKPKLTPNMPVPPIVRES
jgi:aspartyl-tRNA(Asn)/glutamyl-tRNA(Gln) amidotransferase subunit A